MIRSALTDVSLCVNLSLSVNAHLKLSLKVQHKKKKSACNWFQVEAAR